MHTQEQLVLQDLIKAGRVKPSQFVSDMANKELVSEKQHYWVRKLISEACPPPLESEVKLNMSNVQALFDIARKNGKDSKLSVRLATNTAHIVLTAARSHSRNPGAIYIKDSNRPFGEDYLGKIAPNGDVFPNAKCTQAVLDLITDFAENPEIIAAKYGKLTDRCSFCGLELTDSRSVIVGYGPICARKWGLPWGE